VVRSSTVVVALAAVAVVVTGRISLATVLRSRAVARTIATMARSRTVVGAVAPWLGAWPLGP